MIAVLCPYCGHKNHVELATYPTSVACDYETGGCDKLFLYSAKAQITYSVEIYKLPKPEPKLAGAAA